MLRLINLCAILIFFWIFLSGKFTVLLTSLGGISILICIVIARHMELVDKERYPINISYLIGLSYFPWLLKEIFKSNIIVARAIISFDMPLSPKVIRVKANQKEDLGQTIFANSITLTPGTVSIAHEFGKVTVHALLDETAKSLQTGEMNARVCLLEGDTLPTFSRKDK